MTIPAIPAINGLQATTAVTPTGPTVASGPVVAAPSGGSDFATQLGSAVDGLQQMQSTSDSLNVQAATGNLNDLQAATIAAARVETEVQLASTLRNQAVGAFNAIMNMGS